MQLQSWLVEERRKPMVLTERKETAGDDEVVVQVAGCGVCHTDLGFYYDDVPTRHAFPLTLGHEISGTVVETGPGAESWSGRNVVVPAVIPCGRCPACTSGHGSICPNQIFPGNDVHGGFATHVRVPSRGLCPVPDLDDTNANPAGLSLEALSVIADAVSTPYQAILQSELQPGDLAVFVGAGGVGGFGVQIAAAKGAHVVAIDPDPVRLQSLEEHGINLALRPDEMSFKELRKAVRAFGKDKQVPSWRTRIFETSGTPAGQTTAFGLLAHGAHLGVVGFTPKKVEVRLSNLMAFDATAKGTWGCLPEHYPAIVDLALSGKVALEPFIERRPLSTINDTFEQLHSQPVQRRIVLVPEA